MQEYAFELALCAHLESERETVISRQLGTHVHGRRVMDIVCVDPGPEFEKRAALTADSIPPRAIESDAGPGRARFWKEIFACSPEQASRVTERAIECGFFEREREHGRTYVRQTTRYPDWYDTIIGIENKPDLDRPGALETQLLTDVRLGLVDAVVLATSSHVTGAHRNRIPDEVGIWEFDPDTGERDILREPAQLPTDEAGVEIIDRDSARTEIRIATAAEIERARRRIAERAYDKGWRTYDLPGCARVAPDDPAQPVPQQEAGLPYCPWKGRVVRPVQECGSACAGHEPAAPPEIDHERRRAERSRWRVDPDGHSRRQAGLDQFFDS